MRRVGEIDPDPHVERRLATAAITCCDWAGSSTALMGSARFLAASSSVPGSRRAGGVRSHRRLSVHGRPVVAARLNPPFGEMLAQAIGLGVRHHI